MDVTVATVFEAPRGVVAGVSGDLDLALHWNGKVRAVRWHGEPVLAAGTLVDLVTRFLGRDLAYTYRVVEFVPDERLVMRTEHGPCPLESTYAWWDEEPVEGMPRTGMSLRQAGRPKAMTTLASGAVTLGMRKALRRDLERLRLLIRDELRMGSRGDLPNL